VSDALFFFNIWGRQRVVSAPLNFKKGYALGLALQAQAQAVGSLGQAWGLAVHPFMFYHGQHCPFFFRFAINLRRKNQLSS